MKQPDQRQRAAGRRIAGHAQEDHILDPYQARQKPAEGAVCPNAAPFIGMGAGSGRWRQGMRRSKSVPPAAAFPTNFRPAS